jgi:hypothetical protein
MTKFGIFVGLGLLFVLLSANACSGPGGGNGKKWDGLQPMTMEEANELEQSPTGREWR